MNQQAAEASGGPSRADPIDVATSPLRLRGYRRELEARLYTPGLTRDEGMVVYLHEGGFTGGDLDSAHAAAATAAATLRRRVLTIAYSLAPAEPFPAAVEDTLCALAWCSRHSARVSVAGVEAGGNLAAAAALASRDRRAPALCAQLRATSGRPGTSFPTWPRVSPS